MDISKYGKERKERIAKRLRDERENKAFTFEDKDCDWYGQTVHGLTQDQLAYLIRSTRQTVGTWEKENGKNKIPSQNQLITLCELYGCDYGYLICEYDNRKHEKADIQEEIGLSDKAIDILRRATIITDGSHGNIEDMLEHGILSIEDFERKKVHRTDMMLRLINTFIENCDKIASSLDSINRFNKEHAFYKSFHAIDDVRNAFDTIYKADSPNHYGQWIDFLNEVRPHFSHGEIKDGIAEEMIVDQIYEIWLGLIDEAEHRTRNQHRYAINREFEIIIDKIIDEI